MKYFLIIAAFLCLVSLPLAALTVKPPENLNRQVDFPATAVPLSNLSNPEVPVSSPTVSESPSATETLTPGSSIPQPPGAPKAETPQGKTSNFPVIMLVLVGIALVIFVGMLYLKRK
jgi:hypothetical protein